MSPELEILKDAAIFIGGMVVLLFCVKMIIDRYER